MFNSGSLMFVFAGITYFLTALLYVFVFIELFSLRKKEKQNENKDMEKKCKIGCKDKVRVRWWVTEDFTNCRGNVHFFDVDLKDFSGGDKLKEVRRQIKKEFDDKVSYKYNWEETDG